jgi:hypothetical protein
MAGDQSVPVGQSDVDDWFDDEALEQYRKAANVAYEVSKKKTEDAGEQERQTIGKGAAEQRESARQSQEFAERDEARDYSQAQKARRF